LGASAVPGVAVTEMHCWENAMRFDLSALAPFVEKWITAAPSAIHHPAAPGSA
jgi:hypothetical protein